MWCEFERCFEELEESVTEALIVERVVMIARRDESRRRGMQLLQWVVEGHGIERLLLPADHSTALATRVMSRVTAQLDAERPLLATVA